MDTVKIDSRQTKMIAHRGLSGLERENTCPAFVAAANRSYFGIETDVHITSDGQFVLIHDETTKKVTDGAHNINVEESDYASFKDMVLPDLDGSCVRQDIRIPLLSEYVSICKKYEKVCVLEVKNHFKKEDIKKLAGIIKDMDYIKSTIFISFDLANCINLRELLPQNEIQYITGDEKINMDLINLLCTNKLDLDIRYTLLTKDNIKLLHKYGVKVNCWTCNKKGEAEKLAKYGVDYITTNILE